MKRKYNEINLVIHTPAFLPCDICHNKVYHYKLCTKPYTYCSMDCLEVMILSQKNDYMDVDTEENFSK